MNTEATTTRTTEVVTVTLNPAIDQTVTIPNFAAGKVNRVEQYQSDAGGKGVNVASILADYGHRVAVTGFLGRENVAIFEALFVQKQIEDRFIRIAGQTRVGIKISDPVQDQTTDINFPGQAPTPADIDVLMERIQTLKAEWFVLAGSIPPAMDATIYRDLVTALKARGRKVALDTSGDGLHHAVDAIPQLIKPNIHELEALVREPLPTRGAVIDAALRLVDRGVELVVVSMGEQGAIFISQQAIVIARPPRVEVKSTVGAGDAMVAGIVAGHLRHLPLAQCARLATAFSLDAISHIGSGLSSQEAIEDFMHRATVEELDI